MTGQEHYQEAQRLLASARDVINHADPQTVTEAHGVAGLAIAAAQVHATLALASATEDNTVALLRSVSREVRL